MFSLKPKKKSTIAASKNSNSGFQNPKILDVNLIKDEIQISFDWNRGLLIILLMLVLSSLLVIEVYFGLDWWEKQENSRIAELQAETKSLNAQATDLKTQAAAALAYKDKSLAFSSLLSSHVYWNNFFSWLEKNTLTTVRYTNFEGLIDGEYEIVGRAQTLADVSWQAKTLLDDPMTESVEILDASVGTRAEESNIGPVSFSLSLVVKPEIFLDNK